ncbi:MAG TPA: MTH1187 family thiamine-binding protein [Methanomassiliicoccales archaeon]|nr:MTH1187 family thiamine-binding protein [Methanomassiliicoccales archaeon]
MLAEFSVIPIGSGTSLSMYVAECLHIVNDSGLRYQLTPMGTMIEGDDEKVMAVILRCHRRVLEISDRVATNIKIDERKGRHDEMERRVSSVMEKQAWQ